MGGAVATNSIEADVAVTAYVANCTLNGAIHANISVEDENSVNNSY
jgi:hypothetical protein